MAVATNGTILFSSGTERGNNYEGRNLADIAIDPSIPVLDAIKKSSINRITYHTINQAERSRHVAIVTPTLYRSADETALAAIVRQFDVQPN